MKRNYLILLFLLVVVVAGGIFFKNLENGSAPRHGEPERAGYSRIVSLSPSTTEILFALDLSDRVVGVTRFCDYYTPEAQGKTKVGGYLDPNYEAIAVLEPDLVIVLPEYEKVISYLSELGLNYLIVHNRTVSEIIGTINVIGATCGAEKRSRELVAQIQARKNEIAQATRHLARPGVLVSIGRTMGSGTIREVYLAGKDTFYDELIALAGGRNVYEGEKISYPLLSAEGLLHLNPEIILELVPDLDSRELTEEMVLKDWESVPQIDAVRNKRVYVLSGDYVAIPGPRIILLLEDMARVIHPEIEWEF
jgi:iron complex transport system substrate-binding protein